MGFGSDRSSGSSGAPGWSRSAVRRWFPGRLSCYLLAIGLAFQAIVLVVERRRAVLSEGGALEQVQLLVLLAGGGGLLLLARRSTPARSGLYRVLAALIVGAAGRELDDPWLYRVTPGSMRVVLAAALVACAVVPERRSLDRISA